MGNKSAFQDCSDCPIRHRAVCARCETDELAQLEAIKYYRTYAPGEQVLFAGDPLDIVASVVEGVASINKTMEDGRIQMVGLLLPSDFIGRPGRSIAPFDVMAVDTLTLCCFRRKPFEAMIESTPNIGNRLLEMALDELDAARDWMLLLGRKTAREKIATLLILIAKRTHQDTKPNRDNGVEISLPLTREAMSNYLGLTLETVSRQLSHLKADGIIQLPGKREIVIPDLAKLYDETGDDIFA